jgi:sulfite dehydrogenase
MSTRNFSRREVLKFTAAGAAAGVLGACASTPGSKGKVVVVGGGWGGATAAKYLRLWSEGGIDVTLVEPNRTFISCPISNLVIGGSRTIEQLTTSYDGLRQRGVNVVHDTVAAIDADKKQVRLASGGTLPYDRAVVSPGIEFMFDQVKGMSAAAAEAIPHAWKAGPQTLLLRRQLEAMADGGVVLMSLPLAPYRCPPGPYERASMVAAYFKRAKPRSKVLVLDANPDVTSKAGLFKAAWKDLYPGILEYRPNARAVGVDPARGVVRLEVEDVRADVLNVVPPQRAGDIAQQAGLVTHNNRWCDVDWRSMESKKVPGVHVLGDATLSAPGMPKSGSMANNHAKIAAAAIVGALTGRGAGSDPKIINTCYSFVSQKEAIRVSSVHEWNAGQGTLVPVKGAGGVSAARSEAEASFAWNWARTIWADSLG